MATELSRPAIVPSVYLLLSQWRYAEESVLRMIAGWGRCAGDWEDKLAVCYHVWLQAQIVQQMRERLLMYPGGRADPPAHRAFQDALDAVIVAPSWPDAMAGVHELVNPALCRAYETYSAAAHPVHDLPTLDLLQHVLELKRTQARWYADFQKRHPHTIAPQYRAAAEAGLATIGGFTREIAAVEPFAGPCGKYTSFRMPETPGRVKDWDKAPNIMPMIELDWCTSVEARRLFFMMGYCWEMGVAEQQLRWIYHADFMPWEFIYAEARHMWDESRHGNSGYSRLRDFGLDFEHFGYSSYGANGEGLFEPMTPRDVYEAFYSVTQIAETGYFDTKRYCFEDFRTARDERSAEMMQFDIIDETSHVEYGRIWLETMAERAGVKEDYRKRGAGERAQVRAKARERFEGYRALLSGRETTAAATGPSGQVYGNFGLEITTQTLHDEKAWKHYQWMLGELRGQCPMVHPEAAPTRPFLPM